MTYIEPLTLLFLGSSVIALVRMRHCKGFPLAMAAVLGTLLISWPPVDWLLSRPLESWYPVQPFPSALAQAIVVLGSSARPATAERPYAVPDPDSFERSLHAAWLYNHWHAVPILACGGRSGLRSQSVSIIMRDMLKQAGVPAAMIWVEDRSRSTHENALYGSQVLRKNGVTTIALVVEAQSMLRAELCFRKQGIKVVPAPNEFRTFEKSYEEWIPSWKVVGRNEVTLHETAGLVWYRLRGWI